MSPAPIGPSAPAPRRPWLAALLSAALPGFGQLHAGLPNRALALFLAFAVLALPVTVIVALYLPVALTAPLVLLATLATLGVWVFGIVDAWRQAARRGPSAAVPWQTRTVYLSTFLLAVFVLLPTTIGYVREHQVQAFRTPSGSMRPTLLPGDFLFADMRYNRPGSGQPVRRGDVAIFVYPNDRTLHYVKRIVGLPGDTVSIVAGELRIDGEPVPGDVGGDASLVMAERRVAPGHVFVLGDNRAASRDSRAFGDVPLSDVVGRPRQIWFSHGEDGVRWDRIGRVVQRGEPGERSGERLPGEPPRARPGDAPG